MTIPKQDGEKFSLARFTSFTNILITNIIHLLIFIMKQVKEKRKRRTNKLTPIPKMSAARQIYIKRFRQKMLKTANKRF
jgi:hypothetical protein